MLEDPNPAVRAKRLILCSGKVFYDLLAARKRDDTAIVRIEQLYPFHLDRLKALMEKYRGFTECLWVQEEPENMGAWNYIRPLLQQCARNVRYVGRPENATTSTGSSKKHKQEQADLLQRALGEP